MLGQRRVGEICARVGLIFEPTGDEVAGGDFLQLGAVSAAVVLGLGAAGIDGTAGRWGRGDFVRNADAVAAGVGIWQGYG